MANSPSLLLFKTLTMKTSNKKSSAKVRQQHIAAMARENLASLLLERYRLLQYTVLLIGGAISVVLTLWLLFISKPVSQEIEITSTRLNTDTVDELELVIEERQGAYENPPRVPASIFE